MRFKTNDFNCIERSKINLPLKGVTSHQALDNYNGWDSCPYWVGHQVNKLILLRNVKINTKQEKDGCRLNETIKKNETK